MSYSEMINYDALALECKAICGRAQIELNKVDELLKEVDAFEDRLSNERIFHSLKEYLLGEKRFVENQISEILLRAEEQSRLGSRQMKLGTNEEQIYLHRNDLINQANSLRNHISTISVSQLVIMRQLINDEIRAIGSNSDSRLRNQAYGIIELSSSLLEDIQGIEDASLREVVYRESFKPANKDLSFQSLYEIGLVAYENMKKQIYDENRSQIMAQIRKDMEIAKVDSQTIENTLESSNDIITINQNASKEIINEEVRKASLKIILKAIEERGFLVDRRNNIKIDKDNNVVNVVGRKASGQTAEFKIYLDGRFSYKFDGFEGQACQKDIEPFMNDLEEIYGMKITGRLELWKNPDKLTTQKYQIINENKGKS